MVKPIPVLSFELVGDVNLFEGIMTCVGDSLSNLNKEASFLEITGK
jgi:hypothetical protein